MKTGTISQLVAHVGHNPLPMLIGHSLVVTVAHGKQVMLCRYEAFIAVAVYDADGDLVDRFNLQA